MSRLNHEQRQRYSAAAGEPRRYRIERNGHDFVVICFATLEAARTFAGRFGGDLMPVEAAGPAGSPTTRSPTPR